MIVVAVSDAVLESKADVLRGNVSFLGNRIQDAGKPCVYTHPIYVIGRTENICRGGNMGLPEQTSVNMKGDRSVLLSRAISVFLFPIRIVIMSAVWLLVVFYKNIRLFGPIIFICGSFLAGTVFENDIRRYYPNFSGELVISFVVMVCGVIIAIIEKSIVLLILAIFVSAIVPSMHQYLIVYWPVMVRIIFGGS